MDNSSVLFHPAANIFPMIPDEELQELAEDIRKHGQREPISIYQGMILDGRNRSAACKIAGVEPVTITVNPEDPVAFVMSLNLHRRHLTPSQAAMCAARAKPLYEEQAKSRQVRKAVDSVQANLPEQNTSQARDAAGRAFGVGGRSVDYASRIIEKGVPELATAVDEGRMAVSTAAILATDPEEVQREEISKPKRNRTYTAPPKAKVEAPVIKPGEVRGKGVERAHEAIACLKKIPHGDALRDRGYQIVSDWIKHNE